MTEAVWEMLADIYDVSSKAKGILILHTLHLWCSFIIPRR